MPKFKFAVTETRNVEMHYTVEADTEDAARNKAEAGETIAEEEISITGVSDRYVAEIIDEATPPNPNCRIGLHSWVNESGKLPSDTKCDHCDEEYGDPD